MYLANENMNQSVKKVVTESVDAANKSVVYGVPFSHLFTELQISAIDLQISPNEL